MLEGFANAIFESKLPLQIVLQISECSLTFVKLNLLLSPKKVKNFLITKVTINILNVSNFLKVTKINLNQYHNE